MTATCFVPEAAAIFVAWGGEEVLALELQRWEHLVPSRCLTLSEHRVLIGYVGLTTLCFGEIWGALHMIMSAMLLVFSLA